VYASAYSTTRRSILLRRTRFDAREEDFYEALYTQSRASFGAYVSAGTLLNNYAHIFDLVGGAMVLLNPNQGVVFQVSGCSPSYAHIFGLVGVAMLLTCVLHLGGKEGRHRCMAAHTTPFLQSAIGQGDSLLSLTPFISTRLYSRGAKAFTQ
jgi:hypothetical protein